MKGRKTDPAPSAAKMEACYSYFIKKMETVQICPDCKRKSVKTGQNKKKGNWEYTKQNQKKDNWKYAEQLQKG